MKNQSNKSIQPKKLLEEKEQITYLTPETVFDSLRNKNPDLWKRINAETPEAELAKVLLAWRLLNHRTQEAQADLAECSRASYLKMEGAKRGSNPGYLTLYRMAKTYGVSFKEFIAGPGSYSQIHT